MVSSIAGALGLIESTRGVSGDIVSIIDGSGDDIDDDDLVW